MKGLAKYEIDGRAVFVEVEEQTSDKRDEPVIRGRKSGVGEEEKPRRFMDAVAGIKPAAEAVLEIFQEMNSPDEIDLAFGIKFSAKAGAILASVDSEATFKVSLKWTNKN